MAHLAATLAVPSADVHQGHATRRRLCKRWTVDGSAFTDDSILTIDTISMAGYSGAAVGVLNTTSQDGDVRVYAGFASTDGESGVTTLVQLTTIAATIDTPTFIGACADGSALLATVGEPPCPPFIVIACETDAETDDTGSMVVDLVLFT